ncbi:hypothetical protein [Phenylobacterium sp.]|uniref:hypothetical protein n=1 Tax=Phenylobacterium sp. TaxID=1871053 RepID=UPI002C3D0C56|nr:hypothetical protein [Phenylobacterium sp.]HVI30571.1 hypothetical protein [Phenylobacterium sp.]
MQAGFRLFGGVAAPTLPAVRRDLEQGRGARAMSLQPPADTREEGYSAARHVRRLSVGGRPLLHDERRHQLLELNDTADLIWQALTSEAGEACAVRRLRARGLTTAGAKTYVRQAVGGWLVAGHMAPRSALGALTAPPDHLRRLVIDELSLEVAFHGLPATACDLVAGRFQRGGVGAADRLAVVAHGGLFLFFLNGDIHGACPPEGLAPQLKAVLTELYVRAVDEAFLAHGAMLLRPGASLFLSGPPGAGKTTLALALCAAGWAFGADDIVRVHPDGRASPVPFAACAKSGAWPLLEPAWPELGRMEAWTRSDGQTVRYVMPAGAADRRARNLDVVIVLARQAGARARLEPIGAMDALQAVLESAHAARWSLTGDALAALASRLDRAERRRLVYSDLQGAVGALEELHRGQA